MNVRRHLMVALLTIAIVLLLRWLMPSPHSPNTPPAPPAHRTDRPTNFPYRETFLESAHHSTAGDTPKPTNDLLSPSNANRVPATENPEAPTNASDTNLPAAPALSVRPVNPPLTPPPPNPPPVELGMTNPPEVVRPGNPARGPGGP